MGLEDGKCNACGSELFPLVETIHVYLGDHSMRDAQDKACRARLASTSAPDGAGGRTMAICPTCGQQEARFAHEEEKDVITGQACAKCNVIVTSRSPAWSSNAPTHASRGPWRSSLIRPRASTLPASSSCPPAGR